MGGYINDLVSDEREDGPAFSFSGSKLHLKETLHIVHMLLNHYQQPTSSTRGRTYLATVLKELPVHIP